MKKIPSGLIFLTLLLAGTWGLGKRRENALREMVDRAASAHDPAVLELDHGDSLVVSKVLSDQTQAGLVKLPDGKPVKFWFRSHHLSPGTSYTRFDFADGGRAYMEGDFCCEVILPESIRTERDLLTYIRERDGSKP